MKALNDLLMPKLGLTMTEGLLAEWVVGVGDAVTRGDVLYVVETDKVATEITAEGDGTISEILVAAGETVPVGTVVARWTGPGQGLGGDVGASQPVSDAAMADSGENGETPASWEPRPIAGRVIVTPLARRLAREHGVDLGTLRGSGPRGRIKAADVRAALSVPCTEVPLIEPSAPLPAGARKRVSGVAQAMARRMVEAKQAVPHFYLAAEAEVSELLVLRERLNGQQDLPRLTLNDFVIAAVARALESMPEHNRIWSDGGIVQFEHVDVGIAVASERGLMAPVLHDLAGCAIDVIAGRAGELIKRTRAGKATRRDLEGGAITISNAGMFNVTYMTPIINPPQSAILGVGSVRELFRPNGDGAPVLKREIGLVLAADHRLHDGAGAAQFLNCIIRLLQDPYLLLRSCVTFQRG
jgi:pyruvate dehydrogenase E2 component (dihydrolipoamide acetyltransferase)